MLFQKWREDVPLLLAALGIGLIVGTVDTIFGRVLLLLGEVRDAHPAYFIPFLALAGLIIIYLYTHFGKNAQKGMTLVMQVGHAEEDAIPKRLVPLLIFSTWLTHLFGGSAGREGVSVQVGATIAHSFQRFFPQENASRILLIVGMAAGFGGLFQTPLAATFFALEVLVVGELTLSALLPSLVAAYTASWTSSFLGLEKFSHQLTTSIDLSAVNIGKLILLGLAFGLIGNLFALLLRISKTFLAEKIKNPYWRIFSMGIILSALLLLLGMGRYAGLGTNLITLSLTGQPVHSYDWLLKLILTVFTIAAGFQGGEVTPLFSIGASSGAVLAILLGFPVELAAALGYTAVFGAATNTFLAPMFIAGEVFGFSQLPLFAIVTMIAYSLHKGETIYTAQKR